MRAGVLSLSSLVVLAGVALTGCSVGAEPAASSSPTPSIEGNVYMYEASTAIADCLREQGWDVEVTSGGGWGIEVALPTEQQDAYNTAYDDCAKQTGYDELEMTPDLAAYNYDNTVRVVACLQDKGYSTPDGPTRQAYIDRVLESPDSIPWDPYELIAPADVPQAALDCPQ